MRYKNRIFSERKKRITLKAVVLTEKILIIISHTEKLRQNDAHTQDPPKNHIQVQVYDAVFFHGYLSNHFEVTITFKSLRLMSSFSTIYSYRFYIL